MLAWLALSAACGDSGDDSTGTGGGVGAGPSEVCPPGERELDDHSCVPAGLGDHAFAPGVPADGCGPGFVHDGEYGCDAVLPEVPCGPGSYAVPGETSCSRFDACGTDPWPAVPAGDVIYVDAGFNPGNGDGSMGMPFNELGEAVAAAAPGAVIALAQGSYAGGVVVDKPITIWGRCADMVSVAGQGASALRFAAGSSGSTLRDVALTGTGIGLEVVDATATLEWVWIHDTGGHGVSLLYASAPTSIVLHDVLIEGATDRGLYAEGASVVADRLAVRDVTGRGINIRDHQPSGISGHLELSTALVERTQEVALMVHASDAIVDNSVIADTFPLATRFGRAVTVQDDTTSLTKATLAMTRSNVERAYDGAIAASGTAIDLEHVTVRDIAANMDEGHRGYGVMVGYNRLTQDRGSLSARRSLVERCHEAGVSVVSSDGDIDALVIRSTAHVTPLISDLPPKYGGRGLNLQNDPEAADVGHAIVDGTLLDDNVESAIVVEGSVLDLVHSVVRGTRSLEPHYGRGITAQDNMNGGARSFVTLRESELIDNTEVNLFVIGSSVTVESSLIRDTQPRPDGDLGIGVNVELRSENGNVGRVELHDSAVLDNRVSGVSAFAAEILIAHTVVTGSTANPDGEFGDGVVGIAYYDVPSSVELSQCSVAGNQRAGAATFGALMSIAATRFDCNDFHLDTETFNGRDGEFSDLGGNVCGCSGSAVVCKALSSSLQPPDPPPVK